MDTENIHCLNNDEPIQYPFNNPLHGQMIDYNELHNYKHELNRSLYIHKCFPKRNLEVDYKLKKKQNILFMPIDVRDDMCLQDAQYQPAVYKITICGILEDGRKATVLINGINPYIEIQVPQNVNPEQFKEELIDDLLTVTPEKYMECTKKTAYLYFNVNMNRDIQPEIVHGKYFKEFVEDQSMFIRIYFHKLDSRKNAIRYLVAKGHQVVHDDMNNYFRVVCRDYLISFNVWIKLSKYKCETSNDRICGLVLSIDIKNYKQYSAEIVQSVDHLQKDPTLSMCWDGEMYKKYDPLNKELPRPQNIDNKLFMIGTSFQWYYTEGNQQLLRICFVDKPSLPHPDYLTVVCGEEKYLIKGFIRVWIWMNPDLILGFNDGQYDWPWLKSRAEHYGLLKFMAKNISLVWASNYGKDPWDNKNIISRYYKSSQYKLDAETNITCYKFSFPGCVAIDVRTIFRQLFPNDESSSLNHYLTRLDIPTKLDVNFKDMFDMYEEMEECNKNGIEIPERLIVIMQQVAHYCVIDAQRCHELMIKLYVIMDKRAVSNMSYVSFLDAIERANGMKVRNLIIAEGQQKPFLLKFNNNAVEIDENEKKDKFPGAYVFPPIKGLVNGKLSMQERIDAKLLGWDEVEKSHITQANKLIEIYGGVIPAEAIPTNSELPLVVTEFLVEEIRRPITGLDFNSLYPSLMMTYNLSPEYMILDKQYARKINDKHTLFPIRFKFKGEEVKGWAVRHDNHIDPTKTDFKFGIFGYILKQLFDKRKAIKSQMKFWVKKIEECQEDTPNYAAARFQYEYLNSTQKALKVFMNTFYGEIGNQRSPFFMVQVAGGVTTNGGRNVKLAQKLLEDRSCKVYYGDSDSCYSSMPDCYFIDVDREYFLGKIEKEAYWARLVEITLEVIVKIRDEVNEFYMKDNGTNFLTMAFEEVLFPVLFASKKKYVGVAHEHRPAFAKPLNVAELFKKYIDDYTTKFPEYTKEQVLNAADNAVIIKRKNQLFIRGLDIVKRGMPNFSKEIILDILEQMVDIHNTCELFDIVQNKICDIYSRKWNDPKLIYKFIMTDQYKPHKKNEKMHVFARRMLETYNVKIKPFERVRYIIALKYPYKFNIRGKKDNLSMGELMELADLAIDHGHLIDINEYMKSKVFGQLGRLIAYRPEFIPENVDNIDLTDIDQVKTMEKSIYGAAVKWVIQFSKQYSDKHCMIGPIHKDISKAASEISFSKLQKINICCKKLFTPKTNEELNNLPIWIAQKAESEANLITKKYGKQFVNNYIKKYIEANDLTKDKLPLNKRGTPIYKSVNEYICTRIHILYRRLLPLAEHVFIANNEKIMHDLIRHLHLIQQIYFKFNDMVKVTSDYVVANTNIEPLYKQGVTKTMMMTHLQYIKNFIIANQTKMTEQIMIDDQLEDAIHIYNKLFNRLVANFITIYQVRNVDQELQNRKNNRIGYIEMKTENIDIEGMVDNMDKNSLDGNTSKVYVNLDEMLNNM